MIEQLYALFLKFPRISTDTRNIIPNSIFFALKGGNFDGNTFAEEALKKGARLAIIDNKEYRKDNTNYILVDDALKALQNLANYHRQKLPATFIGITGSNGKTTTKELIYAVLSSKYKTSATKGNFNNHIGVPLTLLSITADTEFGIVEMGANHVGEIHELSKISNPDYGIITNIGKAHLEGFGGIEGVIIGKTELYTHISNKKASLFVNSDDDLLMDKSKNITRITYGNNQTADTVVSILPSENFLSVVWNIKNQSSLEINTQLVGEYNLANIAAAICVGNYFNVPKEKIKEAIETYQPTNNRSQLIKKEKNTIILDAYNANPKSMEFAIESFRKNDYANKVVILGDMLEMGKYSQDEHFSILKLLEHCAFESVFLVGKEFLNANHSSFSYTFFESTEKLTLHLKEKPLINKTILIKGSRGIKLESILEYL